MKKILLFSALIAIGFAACKKTPSNPSQIVDVSFPTVTPVNIYFSIPVGGTLPTGSQIATAYDSVYANKIPGHSYSGVLSIVVSDTNIHTSVPGLYQATALATSYYGYITTIYYYVAVTNISGTFPNLAGTYMLAGSSSLDTTNATVTPLSSSVANGFYQISNFFGNDAYASTGDDSTAVFALITDSTIAFAGAGASVNYVTTGAWDATPANWPGAYYYGVSGTVTYAPSDTALNFNGITYYKL